MAEHVHTPTHISAESLEHCKTNVFKGTGGASQDRPRQMARLRTEQTLPVNGEIIKLLEATQRSVRNKDPKDCLQLHANLQSLVATERWQRMR